MVDTHYIKKSHRRTETVNPPVIISLLVPLPVVYRIAPQLTRFGKCVRRTARNRFGVKVIVKVKQIRIYPYVCTVGRNIYRNVADNLYALIVCVFFKLKPLLKKLVLQKFPEHHLVLVRLTEQPQRMRVASFQPVVPFEP